MHDGRDARIRGMLVGTTTQAAAKTRSANNGQFCMIDVCGALREVAVKLLQRRRIVRVSWLRCHCQEPVFSTVRHRTPVIGIRHKNVSIDEIRRDKNNNVLMAWRNSTRLTERVVVGEIVSSIRLFTRFFTPPAQSSRGQPDGNMTLAISFPGLESRRRMVGDSRGKIGSCNSRRWTCVTCPRFFPFQE